MPTEAPPPSSSTTNETERPTQADNTPPEGDSTVRAALRRGAIPLAVLAVALALIGFAIERSGHWTGQAAVQVTDNAYVRSEISNLASRVSGAIRLVAVNDYQTVHAGDLLFEIDPADYQAAVAESEALVAAAKATLDNLANQIALQRATIAQAEAQNAAAVAKELQARQERERQESLLRTTFGTRQKVEQAVATHLEARSNLQANEAAIDVQRRQLDVLMGTQKQLAASLRQAEANLDAARLRLGYTRIIAPFDGLVGERQVQTGDYVTAGGNLIAIVARPNVYIIANYKETQLTKVAPGQRVDITVDTFPGTKLRGIVQRVSPAAGSQFALLPPDNATGNFTKVVQRVSVRITFEPDQPLLQRLLPGMSAVTRIHTQDSANTTATP